jgi:uncharacterized protein
MNEIHILLKKANWPSRGAAARMAGVQGEAADLKKRRTTVRKEPARGEKMKPEENKRLIAEIYAEIAEGGRTKFIAHLAEDAILVIPGEYSWAGVHLGKRNIIRFFRDIVGEMAPGVRKTIPTRILADEDWVVVEARGEMTAKSGAPYRNHYCLLFRLSDGMIVEMKEYADSAYMERVLGYFPVDRMSARS